MDGTPLATSPVEDPVQAALDAALAVVAAADPELAAKVVEALSPGEPGKPQAAAIVEQALGPPPSESWVEVNTFVLKANTCRDPELAWRAADAPPWVRDAMFRRHPWLSEVFPPQPPPPVSPRAGLCPVRAPRRTCARSPARLAARRGAMRGPPDDDEDHPDEPHEAPPRLPDGGAAA